MLGEEEARNQGSLGTFLDQHAGQSLFQGAQGSPPKMRRGLWRRTALGLAFTAILALLAGFAIQAWNFLDSYESTDNAQVDGHIVPTSSRVGGTLAQVYVQDTDFVKAGQLLAEIDPAITGWQSTTPGPISRGQSPR